MPFTVASFLPFVVPYLPRCPQPVVEQEIHRTVREWFRESWMWEFYPTWNSVEDQTEYTLTPPANSEVYRVNWVQVNGKVLEDRIDFQASVASIELMEAPAEDDLPIKAKVIVIPTLTWAEIPDVVVSHWQNVIVNGILYNLKVQEGQPWFAPNEAMIRRQTWQEALSLARRQSHAGIGGENFRVRFPEGGFS
jgi:hypothetical protein